MCTNVASTFSEESICYLTRFTPGSIKSLLPDFCKWNVTDITTVTDITKLVSFFMQAELKIIC